MTIGIEKVSYIVSAAVGFVSIMGGVWMIAMSTSDLGHRITDIEKVVTSTKTGYELVARNNANLIADVREMKSGFMHPVYYTKNHVMVQLSDGTLLKIPSEDIDAETSIILRRDTADAGMWGLEAPRLASQQNDTWY